MGINPYMYFGKTGQKPTLTRRQFVEGGVRAAILTAIGGKALVGCATTDTPVPQVPQASEASQAPRHLTTRELREMATPEERGAFLLHKGVIDQECYNLYMKEGVVNPRTGAIQLTEGQRRASGCNPPQQTIDQALFGGNGGIEFQQWLRQRREKEAKPPQN